MGIWLTELFTAMACLKAVAPTTTTMGPGGVGMKIEKNLVVGSGGGLKTILNEVK